MYRDLSYFKELEGKKVKVVYTDFTTGFDQTVSGELHIEGDSVCIYKTPYYCYKIPLNVIAVSLITQ